uniref:VWFD domain-containing protein n=1 Tax=Apteryx owenii TaxID=8824 RepID=A0A8B9S9Y2_APTOW
ILKQNKKQQNTVWGKSGVLKTADSFCWALDVYSRAYAGAVCGLCGNADGDTGNDFVTPDGRQLADPVQFADSWKVADVPGCSAGCTGNCPVCNEEQKKLYRGNGYCGVLARAGGPFAACHAAVDPAPFLEDCAFDACQYKGHRDTLCSAVAAYVTACQSQGVRLQEAGAKPTAPPNASKIGSRHLQNWVPKPPKLGPVTPFPTFPSGDGKVSLQSFAPLPSLSEMSMPADKLAEAGFIPSSCKKRQNKAMSPS